MQPGGSTLWQVAYRDAQLGLLVSAIAVSVRIVLAALSIADRCHQFLAVSYRHARRVVLPIAYVAKLDGRTRLFGRDDAHQLITVLDRLAVDRRNNIPGLQAGFVRRESWCHAADHHAILEPVDLGHRRRQIWLELNADAATNYLVFRSNQIVVDADNGIGRHGEPDACVRSGFGIDGRIHTDNFPGHVQQWASGVARIDRRIGLNKVLVLCGWIDRAVLRRNDTGGDCLRQRERAADSDYPVAHLRPL